ncbi:MAG: U32 family peptidase [Bacilli bacterium]
MKKPELLAPAGTMKALKAAILAGADAIYLGGNMFGARSFAANFTNEEIIEAVNYAHIYGVKIYITTNTIIYEDEVETFTEYIRFLNSVNVDAIIIQDIGMMHKIRQEFPDLEMHASTQMHIHNQKGTEFVEAMGLKRAVLARETDYETISKIKKSTNIELEIFIHGALCISYSGQCLMSSLIGSRSGNRGTCAGSCRMKYDVISDNKKVNTNDYNLSTKDLCSLENLEKLIQAGADSFKIEGRMKSPAYVYLVVKLYRKAIDSYFETGHVKIDENDFEELKMTFNRLFTKGFLFKTSNNDLINPLRPNHLGVEIGKITDIKNKHIYIKLNHKLSINDGIRIIGENDTGFIVTSLFKNRIRITEGNTNDTISIPFEGNIKIGSTVLKTLDSSLNKKIDKIIDEGKKYEPIDCRIEIKQNDYAYLHLTDGLLETTTKSNIIAEKPLNTPTDVNRIVEQIKKTGSSNYVFKNIKTDIEKDIFIPIKEINDLRRRALEEFKEKKLTYNKKKTEKYQNPQLEDYPVLNKKTIYLKTIEQYKKIKSLNYEFIYLDEELYKEIYDDRKILKIPRVINNCKQYNETIMIGEIGSIQKDAHSDFSFNVVNSYSVALLHSLGISKITLSYELELDQIEKLISNYKKRYNKNPNLEVIVYGKEEVMISKFNIKEYYNIEKDCYLKDRLGNLYPVAIKDGLMYIYNYKPRNYEEINNLYKVGVNYVRYNLTNETT